LIGHQKGVSKGLKEHLLQPRRASFRSQKSMYWVWAVRKQFTNM